MFNQKAAKNVSAFEDDITRPADPRILELFERIAKERIVPTQQDFFSKLKSGVQKIYPLFTSRDGRNIQQAVSARIMDFDLPDEWFEKPDLFFRKDFDTKLEMIKELMRGNMKGLSFADICLRETVRYLDNVANIANVDRERRIVSLIEDQAIREEAAKRYAVGK